MDYLEEMLGKELYKAVRECLGDRKLIEDDGKMIPKHRFDCVNISLKEHKEKVRELKTENEVLRDQVKNLREFERQVIVLEELIAKKARNGKAVAALIQMGDLTGESLRNSVVRQLIKLKKTEPFLFYENDVYMLVPCGKGIRGEA